MVRAKDYWKNPEKYRKKRRDQYQNNIDSERESSKNRQYEKYYSDPEWRENKLSQQRDWYDNLPTKDKTELLKSNLERWHKNYQTKYKKAHDKWYDEEHKKTKEEVMKLCGNDKIACVICGTEDIDILTIDHKNGRKGKERKTKDKNKHFYGYRLWRKILSKELDYNDFQTLCMNCNWKRHLDRLKKSKVRNND